MKKQILLIGTLLSFGIGFSQNTFPTAGGTAVGIGTGTGAVSGTGGLRLKVTSGTPGNSGIQLTNVTSGTTTTTGNSKALSVDASGNLILTPVVNTAPPDVSIYSNDGTLAANRTVTMGGKSLTINPSTANSQFYIDGTSGNVGVGTITPTTKLEVAGALKAKVGIFPSAIANGQTFTDYTDRNSKCQLLSVGTNVDLGSMFYFLDFPVSNLNPKSESFFGIEDRADFGRYRFVADTGGSTYMGVLNRLQQDVFAVNEDGNDNVSVTLPKVNSYLGIGTSSFVDGTDTYNLSVKGKIRAAEIKVYNTWADYVFANNYNLKPLSEVENFIKINGHLPNVPSANDIQTNGLKLGEMSKIQQEKIEELTLYLIQQNKEIEELKAQVKALLEKKN